MFCQKSQKPGIRLVCRKASDRPAGNAAARLHCRNDFFHASDRCAREGFAIEFHIETAVPLGGNADRGSVLSRAAEKKIAEPARKPEERVLSYPPTTEYVRVGTGPRKLKPRDIPPRHHIPAPEKPDASGVFRIVR